MNMPVLPYDGASARRDQVCQGVRRFEIVVFFSMVDGRRRLHRQVLAELPDRHPGLVAVAAVPVASIVERMGVERAPIGSFASGTKAALAYDQLWEELQHRWPEP